MKNRYNTYNTYKYETTGQRVWRYVTAIGVLLIVLSVSIFAGFRLKLYQDKQAQLKIKENFEKMIARYEEDAMFRDNETDILKDMQDYSALTGETIALIEIPDIDISVSVVEGVEEDDIALSIGHFPQSDMPWIKGGNCAMAGHSSSSYSYLFNDLHEAEVGMNVKVVTKFGTYYYTIKDVRVVNADNIAIIERPTDGSTQLTMTTCINQGQKRLVVIATMNE